MGRNSSPYILGLDLGVQSVGWAVIDTDAKGNPLGIRRSGVRCFDSGVGSESEIASGKDESQNIKRRQMRLQRRQIWRRARRQKKVFHLLQKAGLLPPDEARSPQQRHELLYKLDAELGKTYLPKRDRIAGHLLPYLLRKQALDQKMEPFAFGRALFHLAQRRGFLSNRKSAAKEGEDDGDVKAGISELRQKIDEAKARTLGEYFAGLDPEEQRIRKRWTARDMYLDEFEKIWSAQIKHHPHLSDEWKPKIHGAMFHQRPLKSQKHLIGFCELEPDCRRAPRASLEAQRFRYLQKVNDLEITTPDGEIWDLNNQRYAELRHKLIALLDTHAEVEFKSLRTKLGLKKPKGSETDYAFNLEAGGERRLKGNATSVKLRKVLGDDYDKLSQEQFVGVIDDILEYEKEEALMQRLVKRYGIALEKAEELSRTTLEPNYASLSREAMRKLLPLMEQGMRFASAREKIYGAYAGRLGLRDLLPPVLEAVPQLRNPVVCRGLTELRKVVNALIREYGKPARIRVELARDLKKSRQQREDLTKQNRANEKMRDDARKKIADKIGCDQDAISGLDILKVRLAEECNWECPYTGKSISLEALVGKHSQFDIEHIVPFSRSLDNSFLNKTLCHHEENREFKKNQTPFEAYGSNEKRWPEIIARVKRFRGSAAYPKLRKFQQKEMDADWVARMLQDTRYMSRLATEYLGLLYGGQIDDEGTRRVQVSAGRITAYLRDEWGLNAILADGDVDEKNREDHRHHAIDAIVIALTDAPTVELLSSSAAEAEERGHRLFVPVDQPWRSFLEDVRNSINTINISYRVNRRVSGPLHEETNYSKPYPCPGENGKTVEYRHVRKPLVNMSANEVENIVDEKVRELVKKKLDQIGGEPKKVFADEGNHPYLTTKDGRHIFIHKARIRKPVTVIQLGNNKNPRYVAPGSNHHIEFFAILDEKGNEKKWDNKIVNLFEAHRRLREGEPIIQRDHGPGTKFKFSLAGGEHVEMEHEKGVKRLYRVVGISEKVLEFRLHRDARQTTVLRKLSRARITRSPGKLLEAKARKVVIDPLGNILSAND
jgi:CRISPR-associated endonuclease Csn1